MNKITGKNVLTEDDVKKIEMLGNAGLSRKQISDVTGWSESVCGRIINGRYYEQKEQSRKRQAKKRLTDLLEKDDQLHLEPVQEQETETGVALKFLNNISNLLYDINSKLAAICRDLNISEEKENETQNGQ